MDASTVEWSPRTPLSGSPLLPLLLLSLARQRHAPRPATTAREAYDYVIVGGGAAGSVVAGRLSELPCCSVLLLEAGPSPPLLTEVPGLSRWFRETEFDWRFETVPQKHTARGFIGRRIRWTTGKMLGGSSSFNGMAYVRGSRQNFDEWAARGAEGWSYEDVFPYFLKLEDYRDPEYLANGYHATGGPITVEKPQYYLDLKEAAHEAAISLGYKFVDPNAESQIGFYDLRANVRDNQRCSPVKGYLVPAENRTNLDILVNAMVTKVVIEDSRATGVEFHHAGRTRTVKARREVIVSAGTVNTPKVLMLSGIGPREELEKFDIPVVADLPVGRNFHDHAGTHYPFTLADNRERLFDDKISDPSNILQYVTTRSGPLASTDNLVIAFLQCENRTAVNDVPDYELYLAEFPAASARDIYLKPEVYSQFYAPYEGRPIFRCSVQQLQPLSRGTVTLRSKNPFDPPLIDPNYLQVPKDEMDIVQGLGMCKRLLNAAPLKALGAKPFETLVPGCEKYAKVDNDYFRCIARSIVFTFHHPAGTSKMGDPADETTVVDPQLRVKQVSGLRVVDASVMPSVTSGNTHIPTVMIAEKASDMIKESVSCREKDIFFF